MAAETKKVLHDLYKKYNITDESIAKPVVKPTKPTIGSAVKSAIKSIKSVVRPTAKKKQRKVSLPSGVQTPSDRKMVLDILDLKKKDKKDVAKPGK